LEKNWEIVGNFKLASDTCRIENVALKDKELSKFSTRFFRTSQEALK
jgi:hypothetical protein